MRILLVEDNAILCQAFREALEMHGYDVHETRSGREALTLIAGRTDRFDMVISDLVMSHMNALELYDALKQVQATVRMLIITGYPMPSAGRTLAERPGVTWVQKPIRFEKLGAIVGDLAGAEE